MALGFLEKMVLVVWGARVVKSYADDSATNRLHPYSVDEAKAIVFSVAYHPTFQSLQQSHGDDEAILWAIKLTPEVFLSIFGVQKPIHRAT